MEEVINVALAGHVDHGKSTLVEAITGKFPDRKEFELKRGMTAILKVISFEYKGVKVNLLDTPGHVDFRSAVNLALLAADGLILVVAADEGVKSRTEYITRKALRLKLPVIVAANKIDLPAANPERVKRQLMEIGLHAPVVPISAKMKWGIEELLSEAIAHIKAKREKDKRIVVLGHERKTGIGQVFLLSIRGGTIREGEELGPVKIRAIYDLSMRRKGEARAGEIVYASMMGEVAVGTEILADGTIRKSEIFTEDIYPSKVFKLSLDAEGLQKAMKVLEGLSGEIHGFKVERIDGGLQISVLGDMQMKYIEDALSEAGISFKIVSERRKG
ncbi:MAG: GTP-binding protein, partial [Candidatus Baldrarchaeia archaeon]